MGWMNFPNCAFEVRPLVLNNKSNPQLGKLSFPRSLAWLPVLLHADVRVVVGMFGF